MTESRLKTIKEEPWYQDGIPFRCTECGQCCTGSPGYVWLTEEEMEAIAAYLKMPLDRFIQRYVRRIGSRYSLKEDSKTYDCLFLKGKKCQIYPVRPTQCRTFPWWPQHLETPQSWKEASQHCEGMCQTEAPLVSREEIEKQLQIYREKHPHK